MQVYFWIYNKLTKFKYQVNRIFECFEKFSIKHSLHDIKTENNVFIDKIQIKLYFKSFLYRDATDLK